MDKTAVITGSSTGLGLALAERLIGEGYRVLGVSRTRRHWSEARHRIRSDQFMLEILDATSEPKVKAFMRAAHKKLKRVDLLINNAGYGGTVERLDKLSLKEFQKHLTQNLVSIFLMCKHALPLLQKQKSGLIINISSMAGKRAVPGVAAYSASKFGVVALTQAIAKENLDSGIKCIAVCPGGMNTQMRAVLFGEEDSTKQQSPEFVADCIMKVIHNEIQVETGGDIVIRHGQVTSIYAPPTS